MTYYSAACGTISFLVIAVALNCVAVTAVIGPVSFQNSLGNSSENNCVTYQNEWDCCANYTSKEVGELSVCIMLKYLVKDYGGEMKVTVNNFVIFDEQLSLVNPPPICCDIPYLEKIAKGCIYFYNLSFNKEHFGGCMKITGRLKFIKVFDIKIGCFNIPLPHEEPRIEVLMIN